MLLKRLYELGERLEQDPEEEFSPPGYTRERLRWLIVLKADGSFKGFNSLSDESAKRPELGRFIDVPALSSARTVAVTPKLLSDTGQYVLGIVAEGKDENRVLQCHDSFKALFQKCVSETDEPALQAIQTFLSGYTPGSLQLPEEMSAGDSMTFVVEGLPGGDWETWPIKLPAVKNWWSSYLSQESASRDGMCCVTGERGPVIERLPQPIKGIPGGQSTGMPLISMNAGAFESYGLSASYNAQISLAAAERVGKALNWLLANRRNSWVTKGQEGIYAFWTQEPEAWLDADLFSDPDAETVKSLFLAPGNAKISATKGFKDNWFYAVALSASGSRVVVRSWIELTVAQARQNIARWFRAQRLDDQMAERAVGIKDFAYSAYRDPSKELAAYVTSTLYRCCLLAEALPDRFAAQVLKRSRAEGKLSWQQARLLKLWLLTARPEHRLNFNSKESYMTGLDSSCTEPGYVCGRLLAVWDNIQGAAQDYGVNATLADKYYSGFSVNPGRFFKAIDTSARHHLKVLRRTKPGACVNLERKLQEVMGLLGPTAMPGLLNLEQQALFALGFNHQRADGRKLRNADGDNTTDDDNTTEGEDN